MRSKVDQKVDQNAEQGGAKDIVFIWFQTGVLPWGKLI